MAMRIYSVIGARPQFVKAAVVSRALAQHSNVVERLVHTGQHYDPIMSDIFFTELGLPAPHVNLGIGSGPHGAQTGRMLEALESLFTAEKPDRVLIYGDTNSTLAAALTAAKLGIPVDHIEAGLRSFNRAMPEEINRVVADALSDMLFAPTATAVGHLRHEGIPEARIHRVGDVMYDATLLFGARADAAALTRLGLIPKTYVLATIHRAENTDDPDRLRTLFGALQHVAADLPVILPLHPRTRQRAAALGMLDGLPAGFRLVEPVGYFDMLALERDARVIATDSGGVQKGSNWLIPAGTGWRRRTMLQTSRRRSAPPPRSIVPGWRIPMPMATVTPLSTLRTASRGSRREDPARHLPVRALQHRGLGARRQDGQGVEGFRP
jgi:UDP-GlcNAc3NAcA epimerase